MHTTEYTQHNTSYCQPFMSKVFSNNNESYLNEIILFHVCLVDCIINYAQLYKSSHAVSYDFVSTCRLVVLKLFKMRQSTYKFLRIYNPV